MRATVWIAAAAMVPYLLPAEVPRSQSLAYPLFVGVVWLLIADGLSPSVRVLLVLPLLAVWANLHGSVLVGVTVVLLHGLSAVRRRRAVAGLLVCGALTQRRRVSLRDRAPSLLPVDVAESVIQIPE